MAGRKKIIKRKLKQPDEFISITEKAFLFVKHHVKKIATGGIILFVVLLSIFFFQKWEEKKEKDAYEKLTAALELYQRMSFPYKEDSLSEYEDVLEKLYEVITKFPRTSSGRLSLLYKGNIHLRLGTFDEAIKAYQAFLQKGGREKLYRLFAIEGLGYAYEGKKEYQKAVEAYERMLEMGEGLQVANAHLSRGRCYEKLGKKKEALESYKTFLNVAPKAIMANFVSGRISHLEN